MRPIFAIPLLALIALSSCRQSKEEIRPQVKPLIEAVYASGFVVAKDAYQVFVQVDGYLTSKLVEDGDSVKKGDPIFILESGQQSARFRIAKENYEQVLRNSREDSPVLRELKAMLETARTKMMFDSTNLVRYTNLLKQNATSKVEYDRNKLQYENSRNEFLLQSSRYAKMRDQLRVELQNSLSQLQIASDESGRYIVRSEVNGKVFQTMKDKGELVRRNEVIAILGQDDAFFIQLNVDELDIQRVKKGQTVVVKIDAYADRLFTAIVDKIYPMVNAQQQSLRVDATLTEPLPGAFTGLALEANIIIQKKESAIVIPKTVLLPGDSVLIKSTGGVNKVRILKGIETLDEVEVTQGIDSTDLLIMNRYR
ncbi:MAG: efflux RND transporter periplasmic adaptor subunit [Cyclobacteriaceae bacterium]|nr:efflux RND transporter periplasmic adaptor subunit [Cyclobacteriaceae bacterium]